MSQLGAQSFEQLKQQEKSYRHQETALCQCVTDAITAVGPQPGFDKWEVVFESNKSMLLPYRVAKSGFIPAYLMSPPTKTNFTVIGHEIGHVLAQHSNERYLAHNLLMLAYKFRVLPLADNNTGTRQWLDLGWVFNMGS